MSMTDDPERVLHSSHDSGGARRALALLALCAFALTFAGCEGCSRRIVAPTVLPPLLSVTVSPDFDTLRVGATRLFTATALDTDTIAVSPVSFSWATSDPGVFTVSSRGTVTGVGEGWGYVIASAGGLSDSAIVSVYPDTGWFVQPSNTANPLNGVFFLSDGRTGFAVGNAGTIRTTSDAGATWEVRLSGTPFNLNAVFAVSTADTQFVWACGAAGTVLRNINGSATWSRMGTPASESLNDLYFADRKKGWAVGSLGVILRTTNGGVGWTRLQPAVTSANLRSVAFDAAGNGWAVGDNGVLLGSHDGGASWYIYVPAVTTQNLDAVWRGGPDSAWAVGPAGTTLRVTGMPDTLWRASGVANFQLYGVHFPTAATGYAVGYSTLSGAGAVLRSDDGGASWDAQASHSNFQLNDVYFTDPLHGWAVGNGGAIVHTARGGLR